ncbi:Integrase, catalytic core,Ribonuclease H-like domain [Cinara cedri]|uniref:RNA-directed DNA polymerase n=1 Tax=Cinara cedri TaxID=506608 RepID=A0A5E4NEH0_9HEMI|nr:Integrase, catalytic core,Ribonuclease H-like domain [Cinara cedri]
MYIADTLSRVFIGDSQEVNKDSLEVAEIEIQSTLKHFPMSSIKLEEYVKETENDRDLKVIKVIQVGHAIKEVLNKIHFNHLGIQKCKLRARRAVYWPNMNKDIELKVKSCNLCAKYQCAKSKEFMKPSETPVGCWLVLGVDIFYFNDKNVLLVIDYFSKYIEIELLKKIDSEQVISKLVPMFARFGIPRILKSDGGRQFTSEQFKQFAKDFDIELVNSSPTYAQSNGMVERAIQTVKKMLSKALEDGLDWNKCVMKYRNTPISEFIPALAELLFKKKVKSLTPNVDNSKVKDSSVVKKELIKRSKKQKKWYDKTARKSEHFEVSDPVWIQIKNGNSFWSKGLIVEKGTNDRNFKVKVVNGETLLRNRRFLRHRLISNSGEENLEKENILKEGNVPVKKSERIRKTLAYLKDYK